MLLLEELLPSWDKVNPGHVLCVYLGWFPPFLRNLSWKLTSEPGRRYVSIWKKLGCIQLAIIGWTIKSPQHCLSISYCKLKERETGFYSIFASKTLAILFHFWSLQLCKVSNMGHSGDVSTPTL